MNTINTIPEENTTQWMERKCTACTENTISKAQSVWRNHSGCILFSITMTAVIAVVLVVALNQKTVAFPCAQYAGTTLASDVSVECLQYLWDKSCPTRPYSFPASYAGWWRSSPQGGTLVRCSVTPCGVGSYDNMRTYIQLCNVYQL